VRAQRLRAGEFAAVQTTRPRRDNPNEHAEAVDDADEFALTAPENRKRAREAEARAPAAPSPAALPAVAPPPAALPAVAPPPPVFSPPPAFAPPAPCLAPPPMVQPEAVTTLEDAGRIARRVFGGAHPLTVDIEGELRDARAALRAREAQGAFRTARAKLAQERADLAKTLADASAKPSKDG